MPKNVDAVAILHKQLKDARANVIQLDEAIRTLERLDGSIPRRRGLRKISAAGRARIAVAQRKRWAKLRLLKKH